MRMPVAFSSAVMIVCAAAFTALGARSAAAQGVGHETERPTLSGTSGRPAVGPALSNLPMAVQVEPSTTPAPLPPSTAYQRQNQALMILGGAAFLTGAIIGGKAGTVFMVSGAVVGLYGLFKYLQ